MLKRWLLVLYGVLAYAAFLAVLAYQVGFLGNFGVPKTIDGAAAASAARAVVIDLGLIALFGAAHSAMARPAFKRWWRRWAPAAAERSTYVLQSALLLALLMGQWQALPWPVWTAPAGLTQAGLWALFWGGWAMMIGATFLIDHAEMFGLRQVYRHLAQRPPAAPGLKRPGLYRVVRHPLQLGILLVCWAAPQMTAGRLLFAAGMTAYVLIGLRFEERDLARWFGDAYRAYQRTTPMLVPGLAPGRLSLAAAQARRWLRQRQPRRLAASRGRRHDS